jgi:hypothetical protein
MYRLVLGVEGGGKSFAAWMDLPGRLRVRFRPRRRGGVVRVCYRSSKGAENRLLRGWICRVGCACALDLGEEEEWYASATGQWLLGGTADVLSYPAKSTTLRFVRGRVSKARRLPGKVLPGGAQPWVEEPQRAYESPLWPR